MSSPGAAREQSGVLSTSARPPMPACERQFRRQRLPGPRISSNCSAIIAPSDVERSTVAYCRRVLYPSFRPLSGRAAGRCTMLMLQCSTSTFVVWCVEFVPPESAFGEINSAYRAFGSLSSTDAVRVRGTRHTASISVCVARGLMQMDDMAVIECAYHGSCPSCQI